MRILRLNLLAFGPFSGQMLQFDQSKAALHVVRGSNEAGKSSSLRALRNWLYGIPHTCSDSFLHTGPNLRIGGVVEDARGNRLEFIRRKGREKSLRAADDVQVIDHAELLLMLGGVDESSFCQRFGIGHQELRAGGRAIVEGGGELGSILFAAGAGITDIRNVETRIQAEMQELFTVRGSNPRINKAIVELKVLRDQVKEAQLPTAKWLEHDKALSSSRNQQIEIARELRQKESRRSLLDRIRKARPLIAVRKRSLEELAVVTDAPLLPEEFAVKRREAMAGLESSTQSEEDASQALARLQAAIAELAVPGVVLQHRTVITRLHSELGSFQKAAKDRPGLVAQKQQAEQRAESILQELGREPDITQVDQLKLTRNQRQQVQGLAGECKAINDKHAAAQAAVRRLENDVKLAGEALSALDASRNVDDLKQAVKLIQKHGDLDKKVADELAFVRQLETEAQRELKKLPLFRGTLDELESMPVCSSETVDRFEKQLSDANSAVQKSEARIAELRSQLEDLGAKLEALRLAHDVPSEVDLAEARRERGVGLDLVRRALQDDSVLNESSVIAFIDRFAPDADLPQAFQAALEAADLVADRLRHEADRVVEKATLTAEQTIRNQSLLREQENLSECFAARELILSQWDELWVPIGIAPLSPREMHSWLRHQRQLADQAKAIRVRSSQAAELSKLLNSSREAVLKHLEQLDQRPTDGLTSLSEALGRSEEVIGTVETASRRRLDYEQKLGDLRSELIDAKESANECSADLERWKSDWCTAIAALGLPGTATTAEANMVIQAVDELQVQLKEAEGLRARIDGIDNDAQEFKTNVHALLVEAAEDLLGLPVDRAVADLYDRLSAATKANAKLEEWQAQIAVEESKRDRACSKTERLKATVSSLCDQAGCGSADELPEAELRSARRRKCEESIAATNCELAGLADDAPFQTFISTAEAISSEDLQAELLELSAAIADLDRRKTDVAEAIGSHRNELDRMDGNGRAAEAHCQAEHLLATIRSNAEQYIRLRLAATILKRAIDLFREVSQGPVIARAGELFAQMTLGSFAGLRADYDDRGKGTLVGVRAVSGRSVTVDGMSDGTCDQLYLALRLALLESHLTDNEPLPFIVDDIFIQFDDERAAASLKILAEFSQKTQVIFFTHHDHLVELARRHIASDLHHTHELDCRQIA